MQGQQLGQVTIGKNFMRSPAIHIVFHESTSCYYGASSEVLHLAVVMEQVQRFSVSDLVQITSKTGLVRAKATPTPKLSLLSKLGRVTKFKPKRGTTVDSNSEGC